MFLQVFAVDDDSGDPLDHLLLLLGEFLHALIDLADLIALYVHLFDWLQ